jgi:primosomal protein N' (replication factor Y)
MDADTTSDRTAHERILNEFTSNNVNILIGTQIVTKGLDFENVTLVGVVAADMSLNQEDYRAGERTFNLITQVCGRAGRGKYPGKAVIQTYNPDDETIIDSSKHDYKKFYEDEIAFRQMMNYPPFCEFINITFTDKSYENAKNTCIRFYNELKNNTKNFFKVFEVYAPNEAPIRMINDKYRFRILAKSRYNNELYDIIGDLYSKYSKNGKNAAVSIDVNPQNMY